MLLGLPKHVLISLAYNYKRQRADLSEPDARPTDAGEPEYQWVLDLSAGLVHMELSTPKDQPTSQADSSGKQPRNRMRKTNETVDTAPLSWCVEAPAATRRALISPGASAPASGRDPADPKALMRAWGYSGGTFEHFRQS